MTTMRTLVIQRLDKKGTYVNDLDHSRSFWAKQENKKNILCVIHFLFLCVSIFFSNGTFLSQHYELS